MTSITSCNPANHVILRRDRKLRDVDSVDMFAETPDKNRNGAEVTEEMTQGVGDTAGTEGGGHRRPGILV